MDEKPETFTYTYSAAQQEELKRIREKYAPSSQQEDKMERLRQLDKSAARPGLTAALSVGIAGTLLLGLGMSCTMVWSGTLFVPGILIGLLGLAGISAAYPLYVRLTKKRREKLAPEILRLTDELLQ